MAFLVVPDTWQDGTKEMLTDCNPSANLSDDFFRRLSAAINIFLMLDDISGGADFEYHSEIYHNIVNELSDATLSDPGRDSE